MLYQVVTLYYIACILSICDDYAWFIIDTSTTLLNHEVLCSICTKSNINTDNSLLTVKWDGSDIQGRSVNITQPMGSNGCLWKLRMINGIIIIAILCAHDPLYAHMHSKLKRTRETTNNNSTVNMQQTRSHKRHTDNCQKIASEVLLGRYLREYIGNYVRYPRCLELTEIDFYNISSLLNHNWQCW